MSDPRKEDDIPETHSPLSPTGTSPGNGGRAEAEVHRLQSILDALGDGVSVQDSTFRILYQNRIHKELLGDHVGEICYKAYHGRDRICEQCQLDETLAQARISKKERVIRTAKGETHIEVTEAPLLDEAGRLTGGVGIVRDITDKKRMEAELLKRQKMESVSVLAGGIAHDFNNLLTAILGNISLVKLDLDAADPNYAHICDAEAASLSARDLTRQLLDFASGTDPVREAIRLPDLLRDTVRLALSGSNVRSEFSIPADLWTVETETSRITQVLYNLVRNADQAMPGGGILKVTCENVTLPEEGPLPLPAGRYVKTVLSDHGRGIPRENLPRVFDPYFTTHELGPEKGRGLGLAIVYTVIRDHGGHIEVASDKERGTTFTFYLPTSDREPAARTDPSGEVIPGWGRILVMDDEAEVRDVVSEMLQQAGYEVVQAREGGEALRLYEEARASGRAFDAVLMDLTVPGGMGGQEAAHLLRSRDPHAKLILSSGYAHDPILLHYRRYGFDACLRKPYNVQTVSRTLHRLLGAGGGDV